MSGQIAPAAGEVLGQMVRAAAVPMALVLVDGFVVEAASPAFEAIVRAPIVGASLTESYPGATDLHDVLKLAAQGQGHQRAFGVEAFGVGLGPAATNAAMQWDWAATPVPDGAGGVGAVLVVASDVAGQIEAAERIEMLEGLVFLSRRVSGAEDEAALYRLLAEDIGQLLGAGACIIMRLDTPSNRNPHQRYVRPMRPGFGIDADELPGAPIQIEPGSAAWRVIFDGETFATEDVAGDPELTAYNGFFGVTGAKNGAAVPMRLRGQTVALLVVLNKPEGFDGRDLDLAEVFAAEAALAIENARLFAEEHRVASTLQEALLPGPTPPVPGLEIATLYRPAGPAGSVGGDFYDVFRMHGGYYGMLLGDVSGKGPAAAAQTALVRHMARGLALNEVQPGPVAAELNRAVYEQSSVEGFITMLFGVFDVEEAVLRWANAGHPLPLFWRRGQIAEQLGEAGVAFGIFPHADLRIDRVKLAPGDVVVWFTDGLPEARRPGVEMLGVGPLLRTLEGVAERPVSEIAESLYQRAVAHCGHLEDDVAVLVAKHVG